MAKKNLSYTLTNTSGFSVLIKDYLGMASYYPYNPIYNRIEVDVEFDTSTMKIKTWRGEQRWTYRELRFDGDSIANWKARESAIRMVGEDAIKRAEAQVRRNVRAIVAKVKEGRQNPIWLTLQPVADSVIEHYASDFYFHDALKIHNHQPREFLWFVRRTGTEIILFQNDWNRAKIDFQEKNRDGEMYHYRSGELTQIDIRDAWKVYGRLPDAKAMEKTS